MDREKMIGVVVDDMEAWLERDAYGFWDHVKELERQYLQGMSDKELSDVYEQSI